MMMLSQGVRMLVTTELVNFQMGHDGTSKIGGGAPATHIVLHLLRRIIPTKIFKK